MTITEIRPTVPRQTQSTPESRNVARLRVMLDDPAHKDDWPEIQAAIDYLIGKTFVADLAA